MLTFVRDDSGLYFPEGVAPSSARLAFLFADADRTDPSITLQATWDPEMLGYYALFAPRDGSWQAFAGNARSAFEAGTDRRIGWLDANGNADGPFVEVAAAPVESRVLGSPLGLSFRNLDLNARSFPADPTGISLDGDTFHIENKQVQVGSKLLWTVVLETTPPRGSLVQIPAEGDLLLPMSGSQPGNASFQVRLATSAEGALSLASLEAGCMYYGAAPEGDDRLTALRYPLVRPAAGAGEEAGGGSTLTFDCFLDLNLPEDPDRSFFAFADALVGSYFSTTLGRPLDLAPESSGNGDPGARFVLTNRPVTTVADQSHYYMTPTGSFRLRAASASASAGNGAGDGTADQLLCADLGTEYLDVAPGPISGEGESGDLLTFEQGRAAYRLAAAQRVELLGTPAVDEDPTSAFLSTENDNVTTSWVRLTPSGDANIYYGQPQESPLYQQGSGVAAGESGAYLLSFKPIPIWPNGSAGAGAGDAAADPWPVPMVPYAGVDAAETVRYDAFRTMETEGINPARKALFVDAAGAGVTAGAAGADAKTGADPSNGAEVATWAMTSQSLLAGFTSADLWTALRVAISGSGTLQLTEMGDAMRRALNQNQIFLVTSTTGDNTLYQFAGADQQLEVADWLFDLSPDGLAGPGGVPPILIFKFYDGRSITELVNDLALWAQPDTFNQDAVEIQSFLQAGILDACEKVYGTGNCPDGPAVGAQPDTSSLYYPFWQAVTDPSFAGLLAVNCNISLEDLPGAIKAVLGGMRKADGTSNIEAFRAHHVGVQINDTESEAATPQLGKSSLFGLVDYEKPGGASSQALTVTTAYGFEVEYLRALFTNSELREFQCKIDLTINELFSVDVNLGSNQTEGEGAGESGNVISILGQYQAHSSSGDDSTSGEGVYSFVVEAPFPPFTFDDNPYLDTLTLSKVQFSASETTKDGATETEETTSSVRSRFAMWGEMKFKNLNLLDLFSFDKLTFADMGITMGYDLTVSPGQPPVTTTPELAFAPGNLRFDLTQSKKRETSDSLLALMPFQLKSFLYSENADQPLSDLGYFALGLPDGWAGDNPEVDVQDTFNFALVFDLDLGGVGALVGSLEAFKFSMLIGWQPPDETTSRSGLTVGIQLPEADGKLEINIEGVLKILIERFQLQYQELDDGTNVFVLAMLKSSVEILGKRLPPQGTVDFALFSPSGDEEIGWIVALNNEETSAFGALEGTSASGVRALPAAGATEGAAGEGDDSVFDLLYLGLGQRTGPDPANPPKTFQGFLDFMTGDFYKAFENKEYDKVYHPESEWLVVSHAKLLGILELGFIFYDVTPFYSLKLSLQDVIEIEITYTKVTDSVGLFHIEVGLPDSVRQFQVGAASVTLPMVGIDIYTNGDWKVDVGFPQGDDWSRSAQVQAQAGPIPVTGSGGFYLARLSSATSDLFQGTYDLIAAFGFALRLGVGKDFTKGPLKAGVSLTFYGIIEGAAAYDSADAQEVEAWLEATALSALSAVGAAGTSAGALAAPERALATAAGVPTIFTTPQALYLKGEVGVIGEIYGTIDFKIIQASVNVRIQAAIGLQLLTEIDTSILLYVQASVTVSVTVKIKLGFIKIKIGFSFKASFRFEWKLVESGQQAGLLASGARLSALGIMGDLSEASPVWNPAYPLVDGLDGNVALWYLPELTVAFDQAKPTAAGEAALVSSLGVEYLTPADTGPVPFADFKPFEVLATQMVFWAVATANVPGAPDNVTLEQLDALDQVPDWLTEGLTYEIIEQQLANNFKVVISDIGAPAPESDDEDETNATVFPMIPFLRLVTVGRRNAAGDPDDLSYVFDSKNPVSEEYVEVTLQQWFEQLLVNTSSDEPVGASADVLQPLAEALFTEYFRGVVRTGIDQIVQMMQDRDIDEGSLKDLVETAVGYGYFRDLAGSMSNTFRHGLRLPTPDGATAPPGFETGTTTALYALLWQEFAVGELSPIAYVAKPAEGEPTASYTVKLENPEASQPWVTSTVDWPLTDTQVAPYRNVSPDAIDAGGDPEILALLESGPQSFAFQNFLAWKRFTQAGGETDRNLRPFPPNLSELLSQIGAGLDPSSAGIDVSVETRTTDKAFAPDGTPVDPSKFSWALLLPLTVTKVPAGTGEGDLDHVYGLGGADASIQRLLRLLLDQMAGGQDPVESIEILYQPQANAQKLDSASDPTNVFLLRTNTTTQSRPPQLSATLAVQADEGVPVAATLDEPYAFLRILEQASVTNAPGYVLYYDGLSSVDGGNLPAALFPEGATSAPLYVLVTLAGETPSGSANGVAPIYGNTLVMDQDVTDLLYAATTQEALDTLHVSVAAGAAGIGFLRTEATASLEVPSHLDDELATELAAHLDRTDGLTADELEAALRRAGIPDGYRRRRMIADAGGAEADLNSLYSMVTFRTEETDGFIASDLSMPSGPQRESEDSVETEYRVFVPLYKVAKSNQPVEPGKYLDRYAEIGQPWNAELWLTDAFGNLLPSPKTVPVSGGEAPKNLYFDDLVPVAEWAGVRTGYDFLVGDKPKTDTYTVYLRPDQGALDSLAADGSADGVLDLYRTIDSQIGAEGVSFYTRTDLDPTYARQTLSDQQAAAIRDMVSGILRYLEGGSYDFEPVALSVTIAGTGTLPELFPISVSLGIRRDESLIDPQLKIDGKIIYPPAQDVSTDIPARQSVEGGAALDAFAAQFVGAFPELVLSVGPSASVLPSGSGIERETVNGEEAEDAGDRPKAFWAVRRNLLEITIGPSGDPSYASPKPMDTSLNTGVVPMPQAPVLGLPQTRTFTDVDLDDFGRSFFQAVDRFLAPGPATSAYQADADSYETVALARKQIADKYSRYEVDWLFPDSHRGSGDDLTAARKAFGQQMREALLSAYAIDTVVQYPVVFGDELPSSVTDRIALFGQVRRSGDVDPSAAVGLSTAKVDAVAGSGGQTGLITFLYGTPRIEEEKEVDLDLVYDVSHVEYYLEPKSSGSDDEAPPSIWLQLVDPYPTGVPHVGPDGQTTKIPLVLREYPTPPTTIAQIATQGGGSEDCGGSDLRRATSWHLDYQYQALLTPHDQIRTTVRYNTDLSASGSSSLDAALAEARYTLFQALSRFIAVYGVIGPEILDLQPTTPPEVVRAFAEAVATVAENSDWTDEAEALALGGLTTVEDFFRVTDVVVSESGSMATHEITMCPGTSVVPGALVEIEPFNPTALSDGIRAARPATGRGTNDEGCQKVTYEAPASETFVTHQIEVDCLSVLLTENALAGVQLARNAELLGTEPQGEFIYKTPLVRFTQPVTPFIDNSTPVDVPSQVQTPSPPTLANWIDALLVKLLADAGDLTAITALFKPGGGATAGGDLGGDLGDGAIYRRLKMETRFAYPLATVAGGTEEDSPFAPRVPVVLARSFELQVNDGGTAIQEFSDEYAAGIEAWTDARGIVLGEDDPAGVRLVFDITLYAQLSKTQIPVLRLRDLRLPLEVIQPDAEVVARRSR